MKNIALGILAALMVEPIPNEWLKIEQKDGRTATIFSNYCEKAMGITKCYTTWPPGQGESMVYSFPTRGIKSIKPIKNDSELTDQMKEMKKLQEQMLQ